LISYTFNGLDPLTCSESEDTSEIMTPPYLFW